ncbi:hypothetical protein PI124_g17457 [Phytophthora idaei]|nr:hypothetical protein PI124_g17457 [Phytophthora idaei]
MKQKGSNYFGNDSASDHPEGTTKEITAFFPGGLICELVALSIA